MFSQPLLRSHFPQARSCPLGQGLSTTVPTAAGHIALQLLGLGVCMAPQVKRKQTSRPVNLEQHPRESWLACSVLTIHAPRCPLFRLDGYRRSESTTNIPCLSTLWNVELCDSTVILQHSTHRVTVLGPVPGCLTPPKRAYCPGRQGYGRMVS